MKKMILVSLMAIGMSGVALAKPKVNTSAAKHPNIFAAQKLAQQAYDKITAAQKANEYDMQGHAAKAKDLIEQAQKELVQAAESANEAKK